jgi:rubrerythrin
MIRKHIFSISASAAEKKSGSKGKTMDKGKREFTFEEEAKFYEKEARAEFAKETGYGDCSDINGILRRGMRIIHKARQELASRVEVVHGRWVEWWPGISVIMTGEEMLYRCSACDAKYADIEGYKYCPNCGAKMDGDGNG